MYQLLPGRPSRPRTSRALAFIAPGLFPLLALTLGACASNIAAPPQDPASGDGPAALTHGACEPVGSVAHSGFATCKDGRVHRPAAVECPSQIATDQAPQSGDPADKCRSNADCNERPHGYCAAEGQLPTRTCHYGCTKDADCGDGALCMCASPIGRCLPASCTSDKDCGDGLLCTKALPLDDMGYGVFQCDTKRDQCNSDDGCRAATDGRMATCTVVDAARVCVRDPRPVY